MKESNFTSEVMESLRQRGVWCYKIADSPASWTKGITRFTPEKPCDIVACVGGKFISIECKQLKKFEAFGRTQIRESQIQAANDIVRAGGKAFIFLNIRIKAVSGLRKHVNRLIIFDWGGSGELLSTDTIKKDELFGLPHINGAKGVYDLDGFVKLIR